MYKTESTFESAFIGQISLFANKNKKHEKSPDKTGTIELELSEAMKLAEYLTAHPGEQNYAGKTVVKLAINAWDKRSEGGTEYVGGTVWAKKPEAGVNDVPVF
jgi:hypothetical protein